MLKIALALALTFASTAAFAGDASTFMPLGFSKSGKYYAFAQTGQQDGSGFYYASVAVVDVAKDEFVASRTVVLQDDSDQINGSIEIALNKALSQVRLSRFGIKKGENLGEDLLIRLPTDHSPTNRSIFSYEYWAEGGATSFVPKFEVLVDSKDGEDTTEGKYCTDLTGKAPQMLKLSIKALAEDDRRVVVLHEDKTLPRVRNCVSGYKVQRVTAYADNLVIGLSYSGIGFEGPDVRQMVVTGKFTK